MIRSNNHRIDLWIRNVCDQDVYDPNEDIEAQIFGKKWQAPRLLIMKPSRFHPYVAAANWERLDAETSLSLRKAFAENYVLHLEVQLERAAGQAAVELAKQPRPVSNNTSQQEGPAAPTTADNRAKPSNARREVRKLDTQARYKSWQNEYRRLRKKRPEMSDVWYSQQIAKTGNGTGSSAETIRKHMKK
jgi:hypothetical protein